MFRIEPEDDPSPSLFIAMGSVSTPPLVRGLAPRPEPRAVTADDVTDEVLGGAWVVDLRQRSTQGTDPAAYVGWLRPADDGFALLADSPDALAESDFDLTA